MAYQVNNSSLNSVNKRQKMSQRTCPDVTTAFHDWTYGGPVQVEQGLGREVSANLMQATKSLRGFFGNARNVLILTKVINNVKTKKNKIPSSSCHGVWSITTLCKDGDLDLDIDS